MSRVFKITGQEWFGTEIGREGDSITLRGAPMHWPFPEEKTLPRSALTWMYGDPEPAGELDREFPLEESAAVDSTGELFPPLQHGKEIGR